MGRRGRAAKGGNVEEEEEASEEGKEKEAAAEWEAEERGGRPKEEGEGAEEECTVTRRLIELQRHFIANRLYCGLLLSFVALSNKEETSSQ